jgi:hypothetical protein
MMPAQLSWTLGCDEPSTLAPCMDQGRFRQIFDMYAGGVAYVEVEKPSGERGIGSAFHIGNRRFVTAKHLVEGNQVLSVGTTEESSPDGVSVAYRPGVGSLRADPVLHPDPRTDIAILEIEGIDAPAIPIGQVALRETPLLSPVLVMGYPPIPLAAEPVLVALTAEVCAVVSAYDGSGNYLVLSSTARGGLSGGIAFSLGDANDSAGILGMITRALVRDGLPEEFGYLAVLPLEEVYSCHGLFESRLDWYLSPGRKEWAEGIAYDVSQDGGAT